MKLQITNTQPTIGDQVIISAPFKQTNVVYQWNGPGVNLTNQSNTLTIDDIKLSQSGTYYCNMADSDCNTSLSDSVKINVQYKQETPPCTPVNNTAAFNNIPNSNFSSVTKSFGGTFNTVNLYAYAGLGYPSLTVLFNSYNGNVEPKDGVYITTDRQVFNIFQEPNEISVSFIYSSDFYHCRPGKKVYVSHVNGKLALSFCSLEFSSGTFTTTCSSKMTQTN